MDPDWTNRTEQRMIALETRSAVDDVHRNNVADRLSHIEDALKWVVRLIMGAFIMAAVAYALGGGLTTP